MVRRSREIQRVPHRRQRRRAADDRAPAGRRAAGPVRLPARHPDAAVLGRPAGAQPAARHHRRRGDPGRAEPRACCCARAATPAAGRSTSRTAGCVTPTTTSPGLPTGVARRTRSPRAGISSASSSSRPASPTSPRARAPPAGPSCTSTASSSPRSEFPVTTPIAFNPGGLTCGANPGSAIVAGLPGPVPLHRHAAHRHRRPVRRPHHRHRQRDAHGHGPPVSPPGLSCSRHGSALCSRCSRGLQPANGSLPRPASGLPLPCRPCGRTEQAMTPPPPPRSRRAIDLGRRCIRVRPGAAAPPARNGPKAAAPRRTGAHAQAIRHARLAG